MRVTAVITLKRETKTVSSSLELHMKHKSTPSAGKVHIVRRVP